MLFHVRRFFKRLGLALVAVCVSAAIAHAQDPERVQAFVYGVSNFDGSKYASTVVPPSVDTFYLLADRENIITPRETMIYFWPITNEYLADWNKLNQLVDGSLEIYQDGRLVNTVAFSPYVIQYDVNNPDTTLGLYTGIEAQARYAAWQTTVNDYQNSLVAYYKALGDRDAAITKLRNESPDGVIPPDKAPPEVPQPQRPQILSTTPAQGYVLKLAPGTYDVQVKRADGSFQPDSRKKLVMFDKQQDGTSYSVVPSTRWNLPEQSDEPDSVIYALPGTTLYLQAFRAGEYNDYQYAHMLDPQDQVSQAGNGKWVSFDPTTKPLMRVQSNNQTVTQVASQPYLVQQISGGGLGYQVLPFDAKTMQNPTFNGYTIPLKSPGEEYAVELVDANGAVLPGSQRRVIALNSAQVPAPYVLSALPLLIGGVVLVVRRRQARRVKVDE